MLYIAFFLEGGLLLVALPWSSYWDQNYFRLVAPLLDRLLGNHFMRGAISGLGVLNLVAGISELLPPAEPRR